MDHSPLEAISWEKNSSLSFKTEVQHRIHNSLSVTPIPSQMTSISVNTHQSLGSILILFSQVTLSSQVFLLKLGRRLLSVPCVLDVPPNPHVIGLIIY